MRLLAWYSDEDVDRWRGGVGVGGWSERGCKASNTDQSIKPSLKIQPDTTSEVISVGGHNGRLKAEGTGTTAQTCVSHVHSVLTFPLRVAFSAKNFAAFFVCFVCLVFFNHFPACQVYRKGSNPDWLAAKSKAKALKWVWGC